MKELSLLVLIVISFICCEPGKSFKLQQALYQVEETPFSDKTSLMITCEKEHPENVSLNLSYLGIRKLSKEFISNPHVTCLNLKGNEIKEGTLDAFKNLSNLAYLNLANNRINVDNFIGFGYSHPNLKILILDDVEFQEGNLKYQNYPVYYNKGTQSIQINALLPKLEHLYLRNISAENISSICYTNVPKLTHLYLSDNNFGNLFNEFLENIPPSLTHLSIERCNILINRVLNQSTSLISLSLDGNKLPCLGNDCMDFQNFPKLKYLSIAANGINLVSSTAFDFNSDLVYLDISRNPIHEFPEGTFNKLSNMEILNLNHNQLSRTPSFCGLKKLSELYINYNNIRNLYPNSFSCVKELKSLSLSGNGIYKILPGTFDDLPNLTSLNLSQNKISKLKYQSPLNLQYLNLKDNLFNSVEDILLGQNSLISLILTNNPMFVVKLQSLKFLKENATIFVNEFRESEKKLLFQEPFY